MIAEGERGCLLLKVIDSADAYLVVYAIDDRESYKGAQIIISEILGRCKIASAIVLVGNKTDLVRARSVSYDGEWLAFRIDWLFNTPPRHPSTHLPRLSSIHCSTHLSLSPSIYLSSYRVCMCFLFK